MASRYWTWVTERNADVISRENTIDHVSIWFEYRTPYLKEKEEVGTVPRENSIDAMTNTIPSASRRVPNTLVNPLVVC